LTIRHRTPVTQTGHLRSRFLARMAQCTFVSIVFAGACGGHGPFEVVGAPSGTFSISVHQQLDIQMGTAGPGEYVSPPTLNGSALEFLSVTAGETMPSGGSQIFHFKGIAR